MIRKLFFLFALVCLFSLSFTQEAEYDYENESTPVEFDGEDGEYEDYENESTPVEYGGEEYGFDEDEAGWGEEEWNGWNEEDLGENEFEDINIIH